MAIIKMGALAQDVRGTLNGTVFSRNRGGAYVRSKVSPVQPLTDFNGMSRAIFGAISQRWSNTLTDAQRAGWEAFAAVHTFVNIFGDQIVLGGIAFYQAANRRIMQVGGDYVDTAPPGWDVADMGSCVVAAHVTTGALATFTVTIGRPLLYGEGLYVFGTPPLLGARSVQKNDLRLVNTPVSGTFTSGENIHVEYAARFAPLVWAAGDRFAVRVAVLNEDTGAISSPVLVNGVVT